MSDDLKELASLIAGGADNGRPNQFFRIGVATAVNTGAHTATVTVGGASIANVPYDLDLAVTSTSRVRVLFDEGVPAITGRIA